jgi:hypothetical protein
MHPTCCGLGESNTMKLPYEGINFNGQEFSFKRSGISMGRKLLEESSRFFSVEHEEGSSSKGINVLLIIF